MAIFLTMLALGQLALVSAASKVRPEHVLANGLLVALVWIGPRTREYAVYAMPLWISGLLFDSQPMWLKFRGAPHTGDIWNLEAKLFPAPLPASTWPEWFNTHNNTILDFICGGGYATYLIEFFGVVLIAAFVDKTMFRLITWTWCFLNIVGLITYFVLPVAPPWYVMKYGMGAADVTAVASAAGAARFDALLGIHYFQAFYSRNPNVFGAMPSLHCAYPTIVLICAWGWGRWARIGFAAFVGLMMFSAVYLSHHYILDVIAGVAVGTIVALITKAALGPVFEPDVEIEHAGDPSLVVG